jgi:hypothetical protein
VPFIFPGPAGLITQPSSAPATRIAFSISASEVPLGGAMSVSTFMIGAVRQAPTAIANDARMQTRARRRALNLMR